MLNHTRIACIILLAQCLPLAAFQTEKHTPPSLQELAANVCVQQAAKDQSFFKTLKQTATTTQSLIPFKSTQLFTKTSITNPWGVGTYEITVSPTSNLLFTRDGNNLGDLHTYKKGFIQKKQKPHGLHPSDTRAATDYTYVASATDNFNLIDCTNAVLATDNFSLIVSLKAQGTRTVLQTTTASNNVEEVLNPGRLNLRLGSRAFAVRELSCFAAPNGHDILIYNSDTAKVHRSWSRTGEDAREMQLPKCDFHAISDDGSLFIGCTKSKQEEKCTLHIINLAKHFYPAAQSAGSTAPENISTAIKLPIKAGTISISPDNQHVALLPAWSMIPSEKSPEPECVYVHTMKDLLANTKDMPKPKEFFCPEGKKPSCITWIQKDRIALGSETGDITLHNHETSKELFKMRSQNYRVTALAYDAVKNFLFAGYESTEKGQMLELVALDSTEPLSAKQHAITAILHRAATNKVWANHFDTQHEKLPQYAQQLIANTMTPGIRRELEALKGEHLREEHFLHVQAQSDIERSASRVCSIQ